MTIEPWKTIGEKSLVKTRWLDARLERCEIAAGVVIDDYTVLHYPDFSGAIALTPDGRFLMTRQWRQGAQVISLECAGGLTDPGETHQDAAARELLEETGYRGIVKGQLIKMRPNPANQRNWFVGTLITDCQKVTEPVASATEKLDVMAMSADELLETITSGEMVHSMYIASVLKVIVEYPELVGRK